MEVLFHRKRLVLLFAVVISAILTMLLGEENKVYAAFSGEGEGSSGSPYIITNVDQLNEVRDDLDAYYQLGGNLNLAGENWVPIGVWNPSQPFTGVFDGNGYTISNLTINTGGAGTNNLGLFSFITNAEIRNVGLVNVKITAANGDYIGGLVGYSQNSTMDNVYVTGTVAGDQTVGGLAGYVSGNPGDGIRNSYSAVKATGTANVGGLIGKKDGYGAVEDSYYNSDLTAGSDGGEPLTEANMKNSSHFDGWYFTEDVGDESEWGIFEGITYPMHRRTFDRITLDALDVTVGSGPDAGDPIELEPAFARDQLTYSGIVPNAVNKVTVSANALGSVSSIDSGGGTSAETIDLIEGANTIHIKVSSSGAAVPAPCGDPCTLSSPFIVDYSLNINREDGSAYPHSISTAEQLAAIGTGDTDGYQLGDHYTLINDIDLSEYLSASGGGYNGAKGWDPIGDAAHPFTGTFEGNGHVIRNLFIDREDEEYIGLFGVASGTIQSVGLSNMDITGQLTVGGLVGSLLDGGSITKAYTTGTVRATSQSAGGLAGRLEGEVKEAYSTANVFGLNGSGFIGGLIGETDNASVIDSYAAGNVTSTASSGVGGLIGASTGTVVADSFWDMETSHQNTSAGGSGASGKQKAEMKLKSTFANAGVDWDFTNTWAMIEGTTYPMFKQDYEAVKLASLSATSPGAVLVWDPDTFKSEQGVYTITSNRYVKTVQIAVALADLHSKAEISGTEAASATVSVTPGDNEIVIETTNENGIVQGQYKLKIQVPAPELNNIDIPSDRYYRIGDTLTFTVSYEGDVDAPVGTPRLPIVIGEGAGRAKVYADYKEQHAGEQNKLVFKYEVPEGFVDTDGIEIGTEIELPVGASITASGVNVPLAVPVTRTNGIIIDSQYPAIILTQFPGSGTLTKDPVTVTVATYGTGSDIVITKWAEGSQTEDFFASAGTLLTGGSLQVATSGTYTVYTEDQAGNGAVKTIEIDNIITEPSLLSLSYSPAVVTNGSVTVSVTADVYGGANGLTKLNWLQGSHPAADFADGANGTDIWSDMYFSVTANGTYTVYAQDRVTNETVKEITVSNIITESPELELVQSPATITNSPVTVNVTVAVAGEDKGNELSKLNWLPGSHVAADFADGAKGTDIMVINQFTVTANGVNTVYAKDMAGNEAVREISIFNIAAPLTGSDGDESGDESGYSSPPAPSSKPAKVKDLLGGITIKIDASDILKETGSDETVIEKVVLTHEIVDQVLEALKEVQKPTVTIEINDSEQAVQVQFPAASLRKVAESYSDAAFVVELNDSSFQLQVHVLDLEALAKQLGADIRDMQVNVVIGKVSGQTKEQLEQIADNHGLKLIGQAVDYKVTVSTGNRTIEVSDLGGVYTVRAIVLDENLSKKSVTAVLYDPETRMLSFVPAVTAMRRDGQKEILMKVPHNSIYTIVETEKKTFSDLNAHWAKNDVELLVSKLIVNGVSETRFAPDDSITRAEFTALLVRALGLKVNGKIENSRFQDVSLDSWYASALEAGVKAGLVDGISNNQFAPSSTITREQMAVMIANALSIAGKPKMDDTQAVKYLVGFDDQSDISIWARSAVAQSVAAGIIQGLSEDSMAPAENATRAQAAVMLKRFLQSVEFMD